MEGDYLLERLELSGRCLLTNEGNHLGSINYAVFFFCPRRDHLRS